MTMFASDHPHRASSHGDHLIRGRHNYCQRSLTAKYQPRAKNAQLIEFIDGHRILLASASNVKLYNVVKLSLSCRMNGAILGLISTSQASDTSSCLMRSHKGFRSVTLGGCQCRPAVRSWFRCMHDGSPDFTYTERKLAWQVCSIALDVVIKQQSYTVI